jgi:hypothetical protein
MHNSIGSKCSRFSHQMRFHEPELLVGFPGDLGEDIGGVGVVERGGCFDVQACGLTELAENCRDNFQVLFACRCLEIVFVENGLCCGRLQAGPGRRGKAGIGLRSALLFDPLIELAGWLWPGEAVALGVFDPHFFESFLLLGRFDALGEDLQF